MLLSEVFKKILLFGTLCTIDWDVRPFQLHLPFLDMLQCCDTSVISFHSWVWLVLGGFCLDTLCYIIRTCFL